LKRTRRIAGNASGSIRSIHPQGWVPIETK